MLTLETRGGVTVCVPDAIERMTTYVLLEQEDWFEDEIRFIRRAIGPGMQVIDIGANYGLYTLTLARCVTGKGKVWAFEPASVTAEFLSRSIQGNDFDNIMLVRAALSSQRGRARLNTGPDSEFNSLQPNAGAVDFETVDVLTLDECAQEYGWKAVDFVKPDAEGEERRIITGGNRFLRENSPLVMFELMHGQVVNHGLIEQFQDLGYCPYRLLPGLQLLAPLELNGQLDGFLLNVFCCKADRAADLARHGLLTGSLDAAVGQKYRESMHWRTCIGKKPYYATFRKRWERVLRRNPAPGWEACSRALSLYCQAHADDLPLSERGAALEQSRLLMEQSLARERNIPRLNTYARILWELGRRQQALPVLRELMQRLSAEGDVDLCEPFLPAAARFDGVPIDNKHQAQGWSLSCAMEQFESLHAYSSFLVRDPNQLNAMLMRLDYLCSQPYRSSEMERRRQLVRLLHGYQSRIELCDQFGRESEDNLNASYWCNRSAGGD